MSFQERTIERTRIISFLLSSTSYPHNPGHIEHIQTHISDVFIAPPYVYKVKKPVDFGFLDFTSLEMREFFCQREVELNRRLCKEIYLGVERVCLQDGVLSFGGAGPAVEYAVRMKMLPEKYFLKNLLRSGEVTEKHLVRIARKLADFYISQDPDEEITAYGSPEIIRKNIDDNMLVSERFIGDTLSCALYKAIKFYNDTFFDTKSSLFTARMLGGHIKDCHGDLHLEHINIRPDGICIYDCIEFNERFRCIDTASDIAFLAMDLDYNGYRGYADFFVKEVSSTLNDEQIYSLIDFYKCYRAFVRGKVLSLKSAEPEVSREENEQSREKARKYYKLALKYSLFGSHPAIIVVFGLIGTGKSTLARMLSKELSCPVISSDVVRKEIAYTGKYKRRYEGFEAGIYNPETTEKTYDEMLSRGIDIVQSGEPVILDASFSKRAMRDSVTELSARLGVPVYFLRTVAPEETIKERLIRREHSKKSVSDARWNIFVEFKKRFEEPSSFSNRNFIDVDTSKNTDETLDIVLRKLIQVSQVFV